MPDSTREGDDIIYMDRPHCPTKRQENHKIELTVSRFSSCKWLNNVELEIPNTAAKKTSFVHGAIAKTQHSVNSTPAIYICRGISYHSFQKETKWQRFLAAFSREINGDTVCLKSLAVVAVGLVNPWIKVHTFDFIK